MGLVIGGVGFPRQPGSVEKKKVGLSALAILLSLTREMLNVATKSNNILKIEILIFFGENKLDRVFVFMGSSE